MVTIWVKEVGIECKWLQCGVISRVLNLCGCYLGKLVGEALIDYQVGRHIS